MYVDDAFWGLAIKGADVFGKVTREAKVMGFRGFGEAREKRVRGGGRARG